MQLAKPCVDIGLATNNIAEMLAFWQDKIGLPFDHVLPIARGQKQYRHDLLGSVLKINSYYEALPETPPGGYSELLIARQGVGAPLTLKDPDGNLVTLVPPGQFEIQQIGIKLKVRDVEAHKLFYSNALGLDDVSNPAHVAFQAAIPGCSWNNQPIQRRIHFSALVGGVTLHFRFSRSISSTHASWPRAAEKRWNRQRLERRLAFRCFAIRMAIGSRFRSARRSPGHWTRDLSIWHPRKRGKAKASIDLAP